MATENSDASGKTPRRCTKHPSNSSSGCQRVDKYGHHLLWCPGSNKSLVNTLHKEIKFAVIQYLQANAPAGLEVSLHEPILKDLGYIRKGAAPPPPAQGEQVRLPPGEKADILVHPTQQPNTPVLLLDVATVSAIITAVPANQHLTQGAAANSTKQGKHHLYDNKWHMQGKPQVIPFVVELGGLIEPTEWRAITQLTKPRYQEKIGNTIFLSPEWHSQNRYLCEKIQWLVQKRLAGFSANLASYAVRCRPCPLTLACHKQITSLVKIPPRSLTEHFVLA